MTSLWFLDNNTIVVTYVTRGEKSSPSLSSRDGLSTSLSLRLRAIFLDAASGKVAMTTAWPTESRDAKIVATHDGNFVTQRGTDLTLYSPDLKELKKLKLPPGEEYWSVSPSPTGRSILFVASNLWTTSPVPWVWVDTDSLRVVCSWKEVRSGWVGISDDKLAMTACVWIRNCQPNVEIRGLTTEWKPHPRPPETAHRVRNLSIIT